MGFLLVCVASPALIRRLVPPRRLAPIVGLWGCFFPVAAAISQLTGGFLVDSIGWRAWWLGAAALAVAVGVAMAAVIPPDVTISPRRPADGGPRATSSSENAPAAARSVSVRAKGTLSTGPLWAAALVMGCYTAQWNGVIQFLPTIYAEAGIAAGAAGALSAGAAACNALGNLSAGQALGRGVKPVTLWTIGFVAMAVCAVLAFGIAPLVAPEWRFGLRYGAVIAFSAVGGLIPSTAISQQMALAPAPDTVSTSLGLGQQFNALGQFAGPVAVAFLVQNAGGWHATWWVTVSFAMVGLLASWWLGFARRPRPTLSSHQT
ncbi:MFS transporter [Kocuria atrinae]|uniref:MFS transporter n=1 Tax=Kocuria atrinae TaxID=592377 RepID=UPI0021D415A9|nr:MFS transporter [Kocuria atrinae]